MATLDLVILRVACFELAHCPEVPTGVVLSEAVDLAAGYGATDDSPRPSSTACSPRRQRSSARA